MPNEAEVKYYECREVAALNLARRAKDPKISALHQQMADIYAAKARGFEHSTPTQPQPA